MSAALSPLLDSLIYAFVLLLIGFALLVLEIFVVSFGLLMTAGIACLGVSVYFAFGAGTAVGWLFLTVSIVVGAWVLRWGFNRIRGSSMVPKAEIAADAGYRHAAERIGVGVGSAGVMVTSAFPTGRARFPGGECDVQVQHGTLEADTPILVRRIDGPIVFVVADNAVEEPPA